MRFSIRDLLWLMTCVVLSLAIYLEHQKIPTQHEIAVMVTNAEFHRDQMWWKNLDDESREKFAQRMAFGMPGN